LYKDDLDFTKMKKRDTTTAMTFAGLGADDGYTNAELWFMYYVTLVDANISDYAHATSGFWTSTETADIDQAVGVALPSYYFTETTVNS